MTDTTPKPLPPGTKLEAVWNLLQAGHSRAAIEASLGMTAQKVTQTVADLRKRGYHVAKAYSGPRNPFRGKRPAPGQPYPERPPTLMTPEARAARRKALIADLQAQGLSVEEIAERVRGLRPVRTSDGFIYESIAAATTAWAISEATAYDLIAKGTWRWANSWETPLEVRRTKPASTLCKPITIDGVKYASRADAARAMGITASAMSLRIANGKPLAGGPRLPAGGRQ
jgi:hypothetical protein